MYLNKNKKIILTTIIAIIIPLMAVGYAILNQTLVISGTSHVDSNWQIEIINITESDIVGDATDKVAPSYTATTARFRVSLINPTDSITYNIKIKNLGNLEARIKKITVDVGESDAIEYEVKCKIDTGEYQICNETNFKNQVLQPNKEQMVKIKVSFKEGYIGQPSQANSTSNIRMTIDYVQNFESNGTQILPPEDRTYSIGDKVTFAGSDWYVIEDSPSSQDYVVLLKEIVLNSNELTDRYRISETCCPVTNGMAYYWSSTCHGGTSSNTIYYGNDGPYNETDTSGCSNYSNYDTSKVKEMLEQIYLPTLDQSKIKEVNNYKIRLITREELQNNLGFGNSNGINEQIPVWVYKDYGGSYYYTMTSYNQLKVWYMTRDGFRYAYDGLTEGGHWLRVRPVINLYKTAIVSE